MEARVALRAGVRAHVLVGDARVLVERLLVAGGLIYRALRALERLLAARMTPGREDLGALGARLAGHGLWHRCL